jgi:hypothetical protein
LPVVVCRDEFLALLMRARARGEFLEPLRMHHGLASAAYQGTRCERGAAADDASRAWQFYIDDMIGFADKVIAYTNGLDQDRFIQNGLNYDATLRNLELIWRGCQPRPSVCP